MSHDADKILDEESIYQILSKLWGIPYKKINPLKLDLNLVTTTIPRSFAMKHLVLPIGVEAGCLVVATPNPYNLEALEDISRATGMDREQVQRVVRLVDLNEYKRRQAPIGVRITRRGFGRDRRYPITSGWKIGF